MLQKSFPLQDQVKYLQEKYSGAQHPFGYDEPSVGPTRDHPVPITNYLNAQCKSLSRPLLSVCASSL